MIRLITVLLLSFTLAACGGGSGSSTPPPPPPAPTIVASATPSSVEEGSSTQLQWSSTRSTRVTISPAPNGQASWPASGTVSVTPTASTDYVFTATGAGGNTSTTVKVTVIPPAPPTVTASITPATIDAGKFAELRWASTNAHSLTISPNPLNDDNLPPNWPVEGSVNIAPRATTTYTLTATGKAGSVSTTATVTVNQLPPVISLTALPSSILAGQESVLSWAAENATSVTIDQGIGTVGTSGTKKLSPAETTTYTATATGLGGTATATATITVAQPAELGISLSVNPANISSGQSTLLTWTSQNAASVTIDNDIGTVALQGSRSVSPTQTTTYTATATDLLGNTKTAQVTVNFVQGGTLAAIKHIIFMVQENRSFDHYFGRLGAYRAAKGIPGIIDGLDLETTQIDRNGVAVKPYHMRTVCHENLTPDWDAAHTAVNNGAMDAFLKYAYLESTIDPDYHRAMGYYDERDIPYYYELASQFATSDRFFASVQAGTIPNRMYLLAGTSSGRAVYPDWPGARTETNPTIFDRLDDANVDWRYFFQDETVNLGWYTSMEKETTQGRILPIDRLFTILQSPDADTELPPVVFIQHGAHSGTDEHPGGPNLQIGVALVKRIVDALMASKAWGSSVFILSHDEHGGFQDHVAPVAAPNPDGIKPRLKPENYQDDFTETGLRTPLIVVSPWVKRHFVSHTPREFTSILKLIETRFALPPLTQRDAWADNMEEFFDFSAPQLLTPPPMPAQPTDGTCDWLVEGPPS